MCGNLFNADVRGQVTHKKTRHYAVLTHYVTTCLVCLDQGRRFETDADAERENKKEKLEAEVSRNDARDCPTGGHDLPDSGDECDEIGLKFSPDYYFSTTVGYPEQKFFQTGYKPGPPSGATPGSVTLILDEHLSFHLACNFI
ncbi:hypothetical protein AVEN_144660-1 [Araneus ventricosus]|uniref:Uncharacterized protein n=1 Tax=Araneus ventricosus TaxID=182803 RepID=A0A4Y2E1V1_ARAVE|nr:hypothetical protein AVEN_144660-1 [Araneus ventricosus]